MVILTRIHSKNFLKDQRPTSGFTQAGVYARRNICANLEVYRPPEPLWNPRLREAATTLAAMQDDSVVVRMSYREWNTSRQSRRKTTVSTNNL